MVLFGDGYGSRSAVRSHLRFAFEVGLWPQGCQGTAYEVNKYADILMCSGLGVARYCRKVFRVYYGPAVFPSLAKGLAPGTSEGELPPEPRDQPRQPSRPLLAQN